MNQMLREHLSLCANTCILFVAVFAHGAIKSESFDHNPNWEASNNRIAPKSPKTVTQDFGFSQTSHAGKASCELGGKITRAFEPAFYANKIGSKTLDDKLSASGSFAFTKTTSSGGFFFGFFRADQPPGGGRPVSSLGLDFDCEPSGARLAVRLITRKNQSCGTFITPFIPGKFRPTPIRHDGTRYHWTLNYDPQGANGRGQIKFTLTSDAHKPGELEKPNLPEKFKTEAHNRFPSTTEFSFDVPEGYKQHGTAFDHFGMMNATKPGGTVEVYFDDLQYNGVSQAFATDPHWDKSGNRRTYKTESVAGAHNFGFSNTSFAGGKPGELGGDLWRTKPFAYYADRTGSLTLNNRLEARGKVILKVGAPDSDVFIGWFNSNSTNQTGDPAESGNFLGIHVGGPTRVGHYFQPVATAANAAKAQAKTGPVLEPGKIYDWSLSYDPTAANNLGAIKVTLGNESVTLSLKQGIKSQNATFDRFGLFNSTIGGQLVRIYLDELQYTTSSSTP